jgi:hypothetical protein
VDGDFKPVGGMPGLGATLHHLRTFWARRHLNNIALPRGGNRPGLRATPAI